MKIISELWDSIKWKLWFRKRQLPLVKYDIRDKFLRRKYCHNGYHRLTSGYVGYSGYDKSKRMVYIRFLKCMHCNYMFFAKKSDKNKYMKFEDNRYGTTKDSVSALLKHSSSTQSEI